MSYSELYLILHCHGRRQLWSGQMQEFILSVTRCSQDRCVFPGLAMSLSVPCTPRRHAAAHSRVLARLGCCCDKDQWPLRLKFSNVMPWILSDMANSCDQDSDERGGLFQARCLCSAGR